MPPPDGRPATWQDLIRAEAKTANVPEALALSLAEQESAFNPAAKSPKGALGLMQLMPETARGLGVDPSDPVQNIRGGLRYLRQQLDANGGNVQKALGAYNAGPNGVPAAGYIEGVLSRLPAHSTAPQSLDDLQGLQIKTPLPTLPGLSSKTPGAPPAPSTFERTRTQDVVTGMRNWGVLPALGGTAGATGGALLGGPTVVGIPAGTLAGGAVGSAAGEAAQIGLEHAVGLPRGGPPVPRIAQQGALGLATDVGGSLALKGVAKVAAPFRSTLTASGLEAMRSLGGKVLPAQATESRALDIAQNVAEASIFGGGGIKAFKQEQEKLVQGLVQDELTKYGGATSHEAAGKAFVDTLQGQMDRFHAHAGTLYTQVDALAKGVQVPTVDLKTWAAKELQKRSAVPALSGDSSLNILRQITDLPDTVPFGEAQVLRSQALAKGRSLTDPDRDVLRGITSQVTGYIDTAMEGAAAQAGPQVEQAFRNANAFYKAGKQKYETDFLRGLITTGGEGRAAEVGKALLKHNSPEAIREARKAIPTAAWTPVQAAMQTQLIEKATNVETGALSGKGMLTQIKLLGKSFPEIFPTTAQDVQRLARVVSTVQQTQGEGTGRMYIQLAQAGATVGMLTGAYVNDPKTMATSGVILLGPAALAKVLTNPAAIRWLTTGLTPGIKTEVAVRAASNLAAFLSAGPATGTRTPARNDQAPPAPTPLQPNLTLRDRLDPNAPPQPASLR